MTTVAAVIPSIPPRRQLLLGRALASVLDQTRPVDEIHVAVDRDREGAAITRTRALRAASTEYVAFLDDDDRLYEFHVERLLACALETDADIVWPWYDVEGGTDPIPMHEGRQWNPEEPHQFPVTVLARREMMLAVGGFLVTGQDLVRMPGWTGESGEDMLCWVRLSDAGAKMVHLPIRTWRWFHNSGNTEGRPDRW